MNEGTDTTLAEWFAEFEERHGPITRYVIGTTNDHRVEAFNTAHANILMHRSDMTADSRLSVEFYPGFGSPSLPGVYVWSVTHMMFVYWYDGSHDWQAVPRHPIACQPKVAG